MLTAALPSALCRRNLLRTGISTVAYLRDLFPEEDFVDMKFNKMAMKQLKGAEGSEANEFSRWLEHGVFKALEKKWVEKVSLSIFSAEPTSEEAVMLEDYTFSVFYAECALRPPREAPCLHSCSKLAKPL